MEENIQTSIATNLFYTIIPTAALAFAIAAVVPTPPFSVTLVVILFLTVILLRLSAWISYMNRMKSQRYSDEKSDSRNDEEGQNRDDEVMSSIKFYNNLQILFRHNIVILRVFFPTCFAYIIILMIRLFAVKNFGGVPSLLDFGPKISKDGPSGDTNIAFEKFDGDTIGHFVQGVLAALLSYPAVSGMIAKVVAKLKSRVSSSCESGIILFTKPCLVTLCLVQLLQSCLAYYVLYSMMKRMRYSSFSQTSHVQNTTEWALGVIFGVSVGSIISSLIQRQLIVSIESKESRKEVVAALTLTRTKSNEVEEKSFVFGKACEYEGVTKHRAALLMVELLSFANLIVFTIVVFLTALFLGLSWNYKDKDARNIAMIVIFMSVIAVVFAGFFFVTKYNIIVSRVK